MPHKDPMGSKSILLMVKKSAGHQLRLVVHPMIYKVLYIQKVVVLGFLRATVSVKLSKGANPGSCS